MLTVLSAFANLIPLGSAAVGAAGSVGFPISGIDPPVYFQPDYSGNGIPNGFSGIYRDGCNVFGTGGNNNDQSHHFAAFLQFGFYAGGMAGAVASYLNEANPTGNSGDIRLGIAASTIGAGLRSGMIAPVDAGYLIRSTLCDPSWK